MQRMPVILALVGVPVVTGLVAAGAWSVGQVERSFVGLASEQLVALHKRDVHALQEWTLREREVADTASRAVAPLLSAQVVLDDALVEQALEPLGLHKREAVVITDANGALAWADASSFLLAELMPRVERAERGALRPSIQVATSRGAGLSMASAPIQSPAGDRLGWIHLAEETSTELDPLLASGRAGQTGESYLVDSTAAVHSATRFDSGAPGVPEVTEPVRALALGESSDGVRVYDSYDGREVYGAWTLVPELDLGLVTELDARELALPVSRLRWALVLLVLLVVLGVTVASIVALVMRSVPARSATDEVPAVLGSYEVLERIGRGATGTVYKARHDRLGRFAAVKVLHVDAGRDAIARFEREVRRTAELSHPNTVQVYDYGETPDGRFYYAMEYLTGLDLHTLVQVHGALPAGRVVHILRQVAASLVEAHGVGLVHRDIKAANVVLGPRGGHYDVVKVCDFGLVVRDDERDGDGLVGTPAYMAPELLERPYRSSSASDLYAVGVLAYFLLAGRLPFRGTVQEVVGAHLVSEAPDVRHVASSTPPALARIVRTLMAKDPAERLGSASALIDALDGLTIGLTWGDAQARAWWERWGHPEMLQGTPSEQGVANAARPAPSWKKHAGRGEVRWADPAA